MLTIYKVCAFLYELTHTIASYLLIILRYYSIKSMLKSCQKLRGAIFLELYKVRKREKQNSPNNCAKIIKCWQNLIWKDLSSFQRPTLAQCRTNEQTWQTRNLTFSCCSCTFHFNRPTFVKCSCSSTVPCSCITHQPFSN